MSGPTLTIGGVGSDLRPRLGHEVTEQLQGAGAGRGAPVQTLVQPVLEAVRCTRSQVT